MMILDPKLSLKWPVRVLSIMGEIWDNIGMEQMIKRLREIGVDADTLEAIQAADDGSAHETALLLIAMFDDRHEYVD